MLRKSGSAASSNPIASVEARRIAINTQLFKKGAFKHFNQAYSKLTTDTVFAPRVCASFVAHAHPRHLHGHLNASVSPGPQKHPHLLGILGGQLQHPGEPRIPVRVPPPP